MSPKATLAQLAPIVYPESDGKPMADNTKQWRWMVVLFGNLAALFRERDDVFVAANLFWYPVEGEVELRTAPDVLVVFGRPKGDRGSYRQWEEGNVPLTVVFEILSPGNSFTEMADKHAFYEEHGVQEYYIYEPDLHRLHIYQRQGETLLRIRKVQDYVSPRLGIRFDLLGSELAVYGPQEQRFLTFEELEAARFKAEQQLDQARHQAARLAELSRKARRQLASADELKELERLEQQYASGPDGGDANAG